MMSRWLAEAARAVGGRVTSLELKVAKTEYGTARLKKAGLADYVEFRVGDALASLEALPGPFDFVLIDLWKNLYVPVWDLLFGTARFESGYAETGVRDQLEREKGGKVIPGRDYGRGFWQQQWFGLKRMVEFARRGAS